MNGIFAKRRARLLAMKAMRDSYVPGDRLVSCPKCGGESPRKDVAGNLSVCPLCGYHFPIGAYYRLSLILDPGSFRELNEKLPPRTPCLSPATGRSSGRLSGRPASRRPPSPLWGPLGAGGASRACWTAGF